MFARIAISPLIPAITDDFGVSNAFLGFALTGMWLSYALMQFPSGLFADRYGERLVILASVGGTTIFVFLLALSPFLGAFVLFTILLGAFAGLHYSVATTFLARLYDDIGTAIGVHNTGAQVAGLVAPVVVVWVSIRAGWRPALGLVVLLGVPVFLLFYIYVRPTDPLHPEIPIREQLDPDALVELLSRPSISFTMIIATVGEFTWQGLASFLPTFLVEYHGYSTVLAGTIFSLYFVVQAFGQVGVGRSADYFGYDTTIFVCFVAAIGGIWVLVFTPTVAAVVAGTVLLAIGMSNASAVFPRLLSHMSESEQGTGFGLVRTVYMIVASFGSVAVGVMADLFGWGFSFWVLGGLLLGLAVTLVVNWAFNLGL
jgi:MFS family permease